MGADLSSSSLFVRVVVLLGSLPPVVTFVAIVLLALSLPESLLRLGLPSAATGV